MVCFLKKKDTILISFRLFHRILTLKVFFEVFFDKINLVVLIEDYSFFVKLLTIFHCLRPFFFLTNVLIVKFIVLLVFFQVKLSLLPFLPLQFTVETFNLDY